GERSAIHVHVERGHEDADLFRESRPDRSIVDIFDLHDRSVGGGEHVDLTLRARAVRIAKEVEEEQRDESEDDGGDVPLDEERSRRHDYYRDDEQPSFGRKTNGRHGGMVCKMSP